MTKLKKYQNDRLEGWTRYCCKNMRRVVLRGEIPIEPANSQLYAKNIKVLVYIKIYKSKALSIPSI